MEIKLNIEDTLTFNIAGESFPVKVADMKPEALVGLLQYGKRKANDTFNSAKGGDSPLTPEQVIEKIMTWDFGSGGSRVSPLVKAQREIVKGYLMNAGLKAKDATTGAKEPQTGFITALRHIIAAQKGVPANKVDDADVKTAFDKNWPKVEAQAEKIVAAASTDTDLDI